MCAEHKECLLLFSVCRTQWIMTAIFSVQNTVNHDRHLQCAEHRQSSPSCCVRRTQTILSVMLCVQNTDNSHRHVLCAEHRQLSPSCCVCRTQTIITVMFCVQNTDKQNTDNSHCHFVRAEHSWAVVWTRPSAVPTTPCGSCSSRTERGTSTVCDTAAYWSVGTDPSRLLWNQDGQTLTQWGTAHHTLTADRSKRAELPLYPSSFIALRCSLCPAVLLFVFFVLSFPLPFCLLCSVFFLPLCLLCSLLRPAVFLSVFFVLSVFLSSFLSFLFSLSCLLRSCLFCSFYLEFFLPVFFCSPCLFFFSSVFFVLNVLSPSFLVSLFSLSCLISSCLLCSPCLVFFFSVFFLLRSVVLCTEEK